MNVAPQYKFKRLSIIPKTHKRHEVTKVSNGIGFYISETVHPFFPPSLLFSVTCREEYGPSSVFPLFVWCVLPSSVDIT